MPAADAGADGDHHGVVESVRGTVPPLREHRAVRVVVDRDGNAEPLLHQRLKRHTLKRQMRAGGHHAGTTVEHDREPDPRAEHRPGGRVRRLANHRGEHVEQLPGFEVL